MRYYIIKNYYLFRFKFLIKLLAEMKSRGTEYFKVNVECILYIMYTIDYIITKYKFEF